MAAGLIGVIHSDADAGDGLGQLGDLGDLGRGHPAHAEEVRALDGGVLPQAEHRRVVAGAVIDHLGLFLVGLPDFPQAVVDVVDALLHHFQVFPEVLHDLVGAAGGAGHPQRLKEEHGEDTVGLLCLAAGGQVDAPVPVGGLAAGHKEDIGVIGVAAHQLVVAGLGQKAEAHLHVLAVADVVDVGFQAEEVAVLLDTFLAEFLLFQQAGLFVPQRIDAAGQVIQELPGFGVRGGFDRRGIGQRLPDLLGQRFHPLYQRRVGVLLIHRGVPQRGGHVVGGRLQPETTVQAAGAQKFVQVGQGALHMDQLHPFDQINSPSLCRFLPCSPPAGTAVRRQAFDNEHPR